jgi:hypothetical protein
VGAAWSADSRSVVVAHEQQCQLAVLYFMQDPPGLEAQLFPLPLPHLPGTTTHSDSHSVLSFPIPKECIQSLGARVSGKARGRARAPEMK